MTHTLTYFEHIPLPDAMPEDDLSTGMVESALKNSIGGVYDYFGDAQRLPRRQQFVHKGKYEGEIVVRVTSDGDTRVASGGDTRVATASKIADLHGKVDDLKSMIGTRGQLWRRRLADDQLTWKLCRLLQVNHVEVVENAGAVSEVQSVYETQDAAWKSSAAITTSVSAVNGVPIGMNVQYSGAIPVKDAILRVQRTSGTITQVTVTGVGVGINLTWTGSIGASQTLEIDDGEQTIVINDTDEYDGLVLGANHTVETWLPLSVGANILLVTVVGGNATVSVEHYNQWP